MRFGVLLTTFGLLGITGSKWTKTASEETAFVLPLEALVGEEGSWTIVYETGKEGVQIGGSVKVQFPSSWFVFPWPYSKDVQTEHLEQPDYVSASTSRVGASIALTITKYGTDGQYHRFGRTFVARVEDNELEAGDVISITFANTQAPPVAEVNQIRIASDTDGNGVFNDLTSSPLIEVRSGPFTGIRVIAPSQVVVGEPFSFRVVALDEYENATGEFQETIGFRSTDAQASLPPIYSFVEADGGSKMFTATLQTPGIQSLFLIGESSVFSLPASSNPILVGQYPPEKHLFWGDLHSHCEISHDGIGQAEGAFLYAHQVSGLSFYALTDHSQADDGSAGLTDEEWAYVQSLVEEFYRPGEFVTFLGYEWSGRAPYGHRNIIYGVPTGTVFRRGDYNFILELWQAFVDADIDVLTVPHHMAIVWPGGGSPYVDWSYANEAFQRVAEVYSLHGASEYYGNPLAYEDVDFVPGTSSHPGPYYLRNGWGSGQKLGVIASSDNHTVHPGLEYGGLTAVYADELTREAIFDAITAGRTYATTGARILLDFQADGHWIGEEFETDTPPSFEVKVAGTADLDFVELVKYDGEAFRPIYHLSHPNAKEVSLSFVEPALERTSLYYLRVKQENQIRGRDVMARSSPIWIVPTPDLKVEVNDGRKEISAGEQLTYTIVYRNDGLVTAEDVYVHDVIPDYTSLPPWSDQGMQTVNGETQISFGLGDVQPGQSGVLTVAVVVDDDPPWGSRVITNTVTITSSSLEVDLTDNVAVDVDRLATYFQVYLPVMMRQGK